MWTRPRLLLAALPLVLVGVAGAAILAPWYLVMPHQPRDLSALFDSRPAIIAHRGWSGVAPENTLAAFRKGVDGGFWIELDVTLAATGEVVVIHDDTLDRTTTGAGKVSETPWSAMKDLDAGSWFGAPFHGERLPTLDMAFEAIPTDTRVLVEMKTMDDKQALPKAVAAAVARARRGPTTLVISFDPFLLESLRVEAPHLLRGQLVADYEDSDLAWYEKKALQNLAFTSRVQQDAVLWQHDLLTPTLVERMKSQGYPVFAWTVNEPAHIERMKQLGVDGIITNHPDRVW